MGNHLINWYFAQSPGFRFVAMATNDFLSSDWSSGLVHDMNNICIRGSIVLRPKPLQQFY